MKNIFFLTFVILAIVSCKNEKSDKKVDYAIISGIIKNKPVGELTINSYDRTFSEPIKVADDGSFVDTLKIKTNSYVLFDSKNPVFLRLTKGDNLKIDYDANDFENSLTLSGQGAYVNKYLLAKMKTEKSFLGNRFETYKLNETDFKAKYNDLKNSSLELMNSSEGLDEAFKALEEKDLHYYYLARLNEYENYRRYVTKDDTFNISEDFLNDLDNLDYTNEKDFEFSQNYKGLVNSHYKGLADKLAKNDSIDNDIAFLKTLGSIESEAIKNGLLFDFANNSMSYSKDIDAFYSLYANNSSNSENNLVVKEKYDKLMALAQGRPSPKFFDYVNYKGGTTSLDDLKGKYVYVDVWATWCGPCKREIPYLKEVENKYHDKNIEFVSVSIDKAADSDKWKNMIEDKELGGMQLFADNDWNSKFVKDYQIQGIPRFILIDAEGNIVNANAPRPSDPKLLDLFTELNI